MDGAGRLVGKVALVTGGTTGIGEAIVHRFVGEGARVVFCARGDELGAAVEAAARAAGGDATFVHADVTDEGEVDALVAATVARHGRLDVVVPNAGTGAGDAWPNEPTTTWQGIIDLNLNGTMFVCRAAWPHLVAAGGGSIVAVSSLSAVMGVGRDQLEKMGGFQPSASYQASKAALEGLTLHLAGRGGEYGIRVNAVRPGRILTDKFREWMGEDAVFWSHYRELQILKRHGHVDDIANAVLFLASDESSFITAEILDVDGGAIAKV
jgi:NAD(P)-dependent dehydrogenase (short-subunit alcohol dehydrogenase family)